MLTIFITLMAIVVASLLDYLLARHEQHAIAENVLTIEKFPPIDDDEFIRRCRPGVNRDVALKVRRIISQQLEIEYNRVYPDQNLFSDLGCD